MKRFICVVCAVLVSAACKKAPDANSGPPFEEISFSYMPSFSDATMIWMTRRPEGTIYCAVQTRPDDMQIKWKTVQEQEIDAATFVRLSAALEATEFRRAAEHATGPSMTDGTRWTFKKKIGGRELIYTFYSPEAYPDDSAFASAITLGCDFARVAGVLSMFQTKKRPNQSPEPMVMSVTPRADARVAPATTMAHL